jgi:hypothetical protein
MAGELSTNSLPDWEQTLEGRPKLGHESPWRDHLRPLGFGLRAEVLEYPGGIPGDVGFILTWWPGHLPPSVSAVSASERRAILFTSGFAVTPWAMTPSSTAQPVAEHYRVVIGAVLTRSRTAKQAFRPLSRLSPSRITAGALWFVTTGFPSTASVGADTAASNAISGVAREGHTIAATRKPSAIVQEQADQQPPLREPKSRLTTLKSVGGTGEKNLGERQFGQNTEPLATDFHEQHARPVRTE